MQVREIMTKNPASCTPDLNLREISQLMVEHDCGCIPVVDNQINKKPIGTITDRDITIRAFTSGRNPLELKASDVMTMGIATITPDTSVQECCDVMEDRKIRRILVVDENNRLTGIVAQADVAQYGPNPNLISDMVHEISESEPSPNKGILNKIRNRQTFSTNRSYQNNQSYSQQPSYSTGKSFSTKETKESSFFSTGTLLPLLAGIGISVGAKYFLDSNKETKPRPILKPETRNSSTGSRISATGTHNDVTSRTDSPSIVTDTTFNSDTNLSDRNDDLKPILEVGRTAGQS